MPVAGGGFDQCYNAQAVVAAGSLLLIAVNVAPTPNDSQQLAPMLRTIACLPDALGLRGRWDRSADRARAAGARPTIGRALRRGAAAAREPDAG